MIQPGFGSHFGVYAAGAVLVTGSTQSINQQATGAALHLSTESADNVGSDFGLVEATQTVGVTIDGQAVAFDDTYGYPFIDQAGRSQVPFRVTLESFGCEVSWDNDTRTAIAQKDGTVVEVPIGQAYILENGDAFAASVREQIILLHTIEEKMHESDDAVC